MTTLTMTTLRYLHFPTRTSCAVYTYSSAMTVVRPIMKVLPCLFAPRRLELPETIQSFRHSETPIVVLPLRPSEDIHHPGNLHTVASLGCNWPSCPMCLWNTSNRSHTSGQTAVGGDLYLLHCTKLGGFQSVSPPQKKSQLEASSAWCGIQPLAAIPYCL